MTRGLLDAGITVVAGIDLDDRCKKTYEHNNRPAAFYCADLRAVQAKELRELLRGTPTRHVLFAGCAPCQSFSQQRKTASRAPDATLLVAFARLVETLRPGQVLIENVPGIAKVPGFSAYRRLVRVLASNGYDYADDVIDARHYGIPQTRRRYVMIAVRGAKASLPRKTHGSNRRPFETVWNAIAHFPPIDAGERHPTIMNHEAGAISERNLIRLRHTPHDGGDRRSWPKRLVLKCHQNDYDGHTDVYGRMAWQRPSPTLTGRCNSISNGRYGHPMQDRAISLREAAALQTFRDDFTFFGSNKHIASQIGNAVPVRLGQLLGEHILSSRSGYG